ncbi:uncharacterized protein LOC128340120 isoform X2 [Hemicordylus capensis]|nr:uncharacterized protein LOC128340120 isoform X2 [Hemicordylus capensis]
MVEDAAAELRLHNMEQTPDENGAPSLNPNFCDFSFHIPGSVSFCTPSTQASPPATQEELDHLKISLADIGNILKTLQDAAALEDGKARYQDIISEVLPGVREANVEFQETLGKFLRELEDHIQEEDHPHVVDEKKKLKEHMRSMERMLQRTGSLAEQLDQVSERLRVMLTQPLGKAASFVYGSALQPS